MAIFISSPSTVAFAGVSTEPVDAALALPEAGFTEELALAMRPRSPGSEAGPDGAEPQAENPDDTLADLQILPPDVLLHAVGDANFALAAITPTVKPLVEESLTEVNPADLPGAAVLAVGAVQATLEVKVPAEAAWPTNAPPSQAMALADVPNRLERVSAADVQTAANAPSGMDTLPRDLAVSPEAPSTFSAALSADLADKVAQSLPSNGSLGLTAPSSGSATVPVQAMTDAPDQPTLPAAPVQGAVATPKPVEVANMALDEVAKRAASQEAGQVTDTSLAQGGIRPEVAPTASHVDEVAAGAGQKLQPSADASSPREALALTSVEPAGGMRPAASLVDAEQATVALRAPVAPAAPAAPNLSAQQEGASAPTPPTGVVVQTMAPMASPMEAQGASLNQDVTNVTTLPLGGADPSNRASGRVTEKNAESALNFDAKLGAEAPAQVSAPVAAWMPEMVSVPDQSLDELSATFVSSLVGGPQRPVTTVMDWIALQPQERPAPVEPHEVRLDSGAVQVEIQRLVKQGGGHIVMELTPPDQSKFTIELKLDDQGGAFLLVEGVSDSTRTRLEQSSSQLHEQFQQMGLNLQLDMRQHRESAASGSFERQDNEPGAGGQPKEVSVAESRAAASARARESGASQIYLYA